MASDLYLQRWIANTYGCRTPRSRLHRPASGRPDRGQNPVELSSRINGSHSCKTHFGAVGAGILNVRHESIRPPAGVQSDAVPHMLYGCFSSGGSWKVTNNDREDTETDSPDHHRSIANDGQVRWASINILPFFAVKAIKE
jgi:hypothetical protein